MGKLSLILNFVGSLVPVLFPDKKFQPQRLVAVLILLFATAGLVHWFGIETASEVIELTSDTMALTTE